MKKTFITGIVMIFLGTLLFGIGYAKGGNKNVGWHNGGFEVDNSKVVDKHFGMVKQLKLATTEDVTVKKYNGSDVKVHYQDSAKVKYDKTSKVLAIDATMMGAHSFGFMWSDDDEDTPITIYIPKKNDLKVIDSSTSETLTVQNLNLNRISVDHNDGLTLDNVKLQRGLKVDSDSDIDFSRVEAPFISVDSSDGDMQIRDSKFDKSASSLSTSDGDVDISDSRFVKLSAETSDGDITFDNLDIKKSLTGDTSDGDVDVTVKDKKNLSISTDVTDGDSSIFGSSRSTYKNGKANISYKFGTTDGDVTVR
ncbi:DUF4097 family beta strand repeat-containing protein [Lentilactobacillus sp. Marseille-Q4993]|uniref:DUF4097 family beta strand repeat-containing protein n=1 Tax=Lentilactobacillus sp. Marseille-Q4993 TaxID=3039492 RepID=UPI0024BD4CEA|nr:DUF4097 family beta strand repeat-containing protein [Lentilactobacillus sp. Marseille-Q4993]